jgi:hypothetical protein
MNPFSRVVVKIREINRRYAKPRIKLSTGTRIALLALRLYLLFLVALLLYRLVITL